MYPATGPVSSKSWNVIQLKVVRETIGIVIHAINYHLLSTGAGETERWCVVRVCVRVHVIINYEMFIINFGDIDTKM